MYKGLSETHKDEVLSDNTQFQKCRQCRDCKRWRESNLFENKFYKSSCEAYPYPDHKPIDIINNRAICEHKIKKV